MKRREQRRVVNEHAEEPPGRSQASRDARGGWGGRRAVAVLRGGVGGRDRDLRHHAGYDVDHVGADREPAGHPRDRRRDSRAHDRDPRRAQVRARLAAIAAGPLLAGTFLLGSAPAALASSFGPSLSPVDCPTSDAGWAGFISGATGPGDVVYTDGASGITPIPGVSLFAQLVNGVWECAQGPQADGLEEIFANWTAEQAGAADVYPAATADGFGDGLTIGDYVSTLDTAGGTLPWAESWASAVGDSAIALESGAGFLASAGAVLAPIALGVGAFVAGWQIGTALRSWFGIGEPAAVVTGFYPAMASQVVLPPACVLLGGGVATVWAHEPQSWCSTQATPWFEITRPVQLIVKASISTAGNAFPVQGGVTPYTGGGDGHGCGYSLGAAPPNVADPNMIGYQFNAVDATHPNDSGGYGGTNCIGVSFYALPFKVTERGTAEPGDATATITPVGTGSESTGTAITNFKATTPAAGSSP